MTTTTAVGFPALAVTCRTLGLDPDQTAAVLEAADADAEAIQRIGTAEIDSAYDRGWNDFREANWQPIADGIDTQVRNDKILEDKRERLNKRATALNDAWAELRAARKEQDVRLNAERADLARRRRELEDPDARRCDFCEHPLRSGQRRDSRFCSPRCRTAACRARRVANGEP